MPSRPSSSVNPAVGAKILLVDDNANGLSARQSVLEELGHRISTASGGAEALELFSRQKFDLVITDFRMPKMDGLELIVRLRKQTPEIPIILISGYVDALGLSEASTGADVVIQKSANEVGHLLRSVNRLLRRKKPAASERSRKKPGAKGQAGD